MISSGLNGRRPPDLSHPAAQEAISLSLSKHRAFFQPSVFAGSPCAKPSTKQKKLKKPKQPGRTYAKASTKQKKTKKTQFFQTMAGGRFPGSQPHPAVVWIFFFGFVEAFA